MGKNDGGIDILAFSNSDCHWGKNHAWIQAAIDNDSKFYSATAFNRSNMYSTDGRLTVSGFEFAVLY